MSEYELDLNIVREIDLEVDTTIYKGADGTTFYPTVSSAGVISWTNDGDKENPDPVNIKGPQGDQGPAGQDGTNGATFTPTVSSAGVISWSNDKGLPNPDSVNIKGPAGQNGQNGQNGATFTPSVSTAGIISWTNDGGLPNPESVDIKGPAGQNGQGVPSGGTTGQVLKKTSATDYATAWADDEGGLTILSYGSSTWNDFLTAFNKNAIVYCRASSNADPSIGAQGRMAFMAYVNMSGSTPTSVEFQYYRSVTTHSDAQQGDQVFVYKLDNAGTWTVTTREAYTKIAAGTAMTSSYSSGTLTLSNDAAVPSGGTAGQVLTVNTSGGYGWETPSGGGGGGLKVNCTKAATPPYGITADKSYADILAAINDGINAVVVLNDLGQNTNEIYALDKINASALVFSRSFYQTLQNAYFTENLTFNSNGTITLGSTYFDRDSWTLRPAIIFNFDYYGSGGLLDTGYSSYQWNLQGFFQSCYPSYAIAVVKVYLDAVTFDHFDIYNCSKVWWFEDEDYIFHGYATFERSRVGVSPDKIYIDELEIEWNQAYDLVTPTSRTAEAAATAISDIYP